LLKARSGFTAEHGRRTLAHDRRLRLPGRSEGPIEIKPDFADFDVFAVGLTGLLLDARAYGTCPGKALFQGTIRDRFSRSVAARPWTNPSRSRPCRLPPARGRTPLNSDNVPLLYLASSGRQCSRTLGPGLRSPDKEARFYSPPGDAKVEAGRG
jgi:hypothetical protein